MNDIVAVNELAVYESAQDVISQESRATISTVTDMERGADLAKIIRGMIKKVEDERKSYTDPLNKTVKRINAQFKPLSNKLTDAKTSLDGKMIAFNREQERIEAEKRRKQAEEIERKALEEAAAMEKAGLNQMADEVIEEAATATEVLETKKAAPTRGNYGSTASVTKRWTYEVVDFSAVPDEYKEINHALVDDRKRTAIKNGISPDRLAIPGIRFYQKESMQVR